MDFYEFLETFKINKFYFDITEEIYIFLGYNFINNV